MSDGYMTAKGHKERAHSKYSASGSERWLNCAASVELEEKAGPKPDTPWSLEGTHAHEGLEKLLKLRLKKRGAVLELAEWEAWKDDPKTDFDMIGFVELTADKIFEIAAKYDGELLAEKRIYNLNIDKEMFGTTDAAIIEILGHLHVFDFKYGQGHVVDPTENTQLLQYALGFANENDWMFTHVTLHILQPRAGKKWHKDWTITIEELQEKWLPLFQKGVARVKRGGNKPFPGSWCHWCGGKKLCSAMQEKSFQKVSDTFSNNPID